MRGLWLEDGELGVRDDLDPPAALPGEALVRVLLAGICNTDLELVAGYYPFTGVPGHEFVGVVEEGPAPLTGRRVVGEINAVCGRCDACRAGRRNHCSNRTVLGIAGRDGAFADYLALPVSNLHAVPDGLSDEAAVFTEPLAAAFRVLEQVELDAGDRVLVVGDGKLGQLIGRTLSRAGCELLVAGRHRGKLDLLEEIGVRTSPAEEVPAGAFDVAVECTGGPSGFALARGALRPGGTLVLKSTYAGQLELDASGIVVDEIEVVGSRCGPFQPALEALATGAVDVAPLVSDRYALEDGVDAFERAAEPGVLKVLLEVAT